MQYSDRQTFLQSRTYLKYCIKLALAGLITTAPVVAMAGDVSVTINNGLGFQFSGNPADRNGSQQILSGSQDSNYLRNGVDSALFNYTIKGQVSAESDSPSAASARLFGDVDFSFNLPTAIWQMRVTTSYIGAQDAGAAATASAGVVAVSSTGFPLPSHTVTVGTSTFFNVSRTRSTAERILQGDMTLTVGIDVNASSNAMVGGEAYAGFGHFSGLPSFDLDDTLNTSNSFANDGILVTLELIPSLALTGQTLQGEDLHLLNGEVLSGFGHVLGNVSGDAGSEIRSEVQSLRVGDSSSTAGVNFAGDVNVESDLFLNDADAVVLTGDVTLVNGGRLFGGNGVSLEGNGTISGSGSINGALQTGVNTVINAEGAGLRVVGADTSIAGTLNVGDSVVRVGTGRTELGTLTTIANGELIAGGGGLVLDGNDTISGFGLIRGRVKGTNAENGVVATGVATLSDVDTLEIAGGPTTILSTARTDLFDTEFVGLGSELIAENGLLLKSGFQLEGGGAYKVSAEFASEFGSTIQHNGTTLTLGDATSTSGIGIAGKLFVNGGTVVLLDADAAELGKTFIEGGELIAANGILLEGSDKITGFGFIRGEIFGNSVASRLVATGVATVPTSIDVGADHVTILTSGTVNFDDVVLSGGSLFSTAGLAFSPNASVTGFGEVKGDINGDSSFVIEATGGDLALGDSNSSNGFKTSGQIKTGNNKVTLNSATAATLGNLTTIGNASGDGVLAANNGLLLNGASEIKGHGEVTADLENQGTVTGEAGVLELSGKVTGAGNYAGDILFSGEFMPGNSPALVEFENITLAGLLNIEIGGLNPGTEYDVLAGTGNAVLGGELDITLLNGFNPLEGNSFDILTAENIIGEFDSLTFAMLDGPLHFEIQYIIDALGTDIVRLNIVSSVPVPASLWLFTSGLFGIVTMMRRRKV